MKINEAVKEIIKKQKPVEIMPSPGPDKAIEFFLCENDLMLKHKIVDAI